MEKIFWAKICLSFFCSAAFSMGLTMVQARPIIGYTREYTGCTTRWSVFSLKTPILRIKKLFMEKNVPQY